MKQANNSVFTFVPYQNEPADSQPISLSEVTNQIVEPPDLDEMFIRFLDLDVGDGRISPDTIRTYRSQIKLFFQYCQNQALNPLFLTAEDIKIYRKTLIQKNLAEATIKLKLKVVKRFYDACLNQELIARNPAAGIKSPTIKQQENLNNIYLEKTELKQLLNAAQNPRDLLLLMLLSLHGLRTIEVHKLNTTDFTWQPEYCYITTTAKRGQRTQRLRADVKQALANYLNYRQAPTATKALFISRAHNSKNQRLSRHGIRNIVNRYLQELGLKEKINLKGDTISLSDHALRHTSASLLYQETKDIELVRKHLGHSDPRSTSRYIHDSQSICAADHIVF